jgi:hypothetical protein
LGERRGREWRVKGEKRAKIVLTINALRKNELER